MVYLATWTSQGNVWAGYVACATREEAERVSKGFAMMGDKNLAILEVENIRGAYNPGSRAIFPLI